MNVLCVLDDHWREITKHCSLVDYECVADTCKTLHAIAGCDFKQHARTNTALAWAAAFMARLSLQRVLHYGPTLRSADIRRWLSKAWSATSFRLPLHEAWAVIVVLESFRVYCGWGSLVLSDNPALLDLLDEPRPQGMPLYIGYAWEPAIRNRCMRSLRWMRERGVYAIGADDLLVAVRMEDDEILDLVLPDAPHSDYEAGVVDFLIRHAPAALKLARSRVSRIL